RGLSAPNGSVPMETRSRCRPHRWWARPALNAPHTAWDRAQERPGGCPRLLTKRRPARKTAAALAMWRDAHGRDELTTLAACATVRRWTAGSVFVYANRCCLAGSAGRPERARASARATAIHRGDLRHVVP